MNPQFLGHVLKLVEIGSATVKKACDEVNVHRQAQKRASDVRGAVLNNLISNGLINKAQEKEAEAMLGSHAETLTLLNALTDRFTALRKEASVKQASDIGQGVNDPTANPAAATGSGGKPYDSLTDPFVGRPTAEKKASDLALFKVLETPPGR